MEKTLLVLHIDLQEGDLQEIGLKIKGNGICFLLEPKSLGRKIRNTKIRIFDRWTLYFEYDFEA